MFHTILRFLQYGPRYDWSATQQGFILGGFFWGCFIGTVPLTFLAEWFGYKQVTTIALSISTILTILTPKMCDHSFGAIYINRVILGAANVSRDAFDSLDELQQSKLKKKNVCAALKRAFYFRHSIQSYRDGHHQWKRGNS